MNTKTYKQYPHGQGLRAVPSLKQLPGLESDGTKDSKGNQLTLMLMVET